MDLRRIVTSFLLVTLSLPCLGFEWEGRLARLRRELSDPDPARRRQVVQLLSSYPAAEVRGALLSALEDADSGVRAQAADAVGRARVLDAVPRLLDWLDEADPDVRAAAARALGQIGADRAVPRLVRVLGDSNAAVRRAGVAALASIGGDAVIVPLLGRLDDGDPRVRVDAATVLGHLGDPRATVPLVGRARDETPEVRTAVYAALGDLGDRRAAAALIHGLRDESPDPRLAAIAALGRIGTEGSARPLAAALRGQTDGRVAAALTAALGQVSGHEARAALIAALGPPATRGIATQALIERARHNARAGGGAQNEQLVLDLAAALAQRLEHSGAGRGADPGHAAQVVSALIDLSAVHPIGSAFGALLSALERGRGPVPLVLRALGATGDGAALIPLLERIGSTQVVERLAAFEALRRFFDLAGPDGRAADPLLAALGRVTHEERAVVVELLGRVGATRALPALRRLLEHRDTALRLAAIRAIGAIGEPQGASTLVGLLGDRDARVRFEAARAVGSAASAAAIDGLIERALENRPRDRHALLQALADAIPRLAREGALSPDSAERAVHMLLSLARSDDETLAARALDVLTAWHPEAAAEPIAARARRASPTRALALIPALGAFDDDGARATLRALFDRPAVQLRTQAASVMGEHGGAAEAALLLRRGPSLPWPASAAAAFALARLARRGVFDLEGEAGLEAHRQLCAMAASHDPFVRANLATAMAALAAPPCQGGVQPLDWLDRAHAGVVRGPAARWAAASAAAGHTAAGPVAEALRACADEPLAPELSAVCARPILPSLASSADVFAYDSSERELLASHLVALRLSDGSVWVTYTDADGHLRLDGVSAGVLVLEDPSATPLEP